MSSSDSRTLTTTSYAILGYLYTRPYSPYELARQMERDLRFWWPRAERAIYYEPKNLVAHGLAKATTGLTGKRARTVYSITRAGRTAFKRWLQQPPSAPPRLEAEALVRATFAHRGSKEALLDALRSVREHAATLRRQTVEVSQEYLESRGPFPEHLHVIALTGRLAIDYANLLDDWAHWAEAQVARWTTVNAASEVPLDFAFDVFRSAGRTSPETLVASSDSA